MHMWACLNSGSPQTMPDIKSGVCHVAEMGLRKSLMKMDCTCLCIYVYMYLCMYVCIYLSIYVSMYLCIYVSMYLCIYVCMYLCIYVSMYLCIYVSMYLCVYVSMYLCIYVSMYLCIYVCIFIHDYHLGKLHHFTTLKSSAMAGDDSPNPIPMIPGSVTTWGHIFFWPRSCLVGSAFITSWFKDCDLTKQHVDQAR